MTRRRTAHTLGRKKSSLPTRPPEPGYWFDGKAARRAVEFFPRYLRHIKGRWAGQPIVLEPWQVRIVEDLFGWKRLGPGRKRLDVRRYRVAYISIARKAGKSTIAAGLALILLMADGEEGAEVYGAAADRKQASIVFGIARGMVERSEALLQRCRCFVRRIVFPARSSWYETLSADVPSKHGLNAHGIIFDEFHVQDDREFYDVLHTSTGAREQPLEILITTAGYDRNSICYEMHQKALGVLAGEINDPEFYAVVYAADETDDWTDPDIWRKANPNLGVTISLDYLQAECRKAQESPAYENTFRRLHLNQWTEQETRWMPIEQWDACNGEVLSEELRGRPCYGGLDLASTTDLASLVWVFPDDDGGFDVLARFWCPVEGLRQRVRKNKVKYDEWSRAGYLTPTEGNVIDYRVIRHQLEQDGEQFEIRELAYDRWGATQLITDLMDDGLVCVPFGQGFASMSAPTKELLTLVLGQNIRHGGNPVLRWCARNVVVSQDPAGNLKPNKAKSTEKIDGMVALIMALGRAIVHSEGEHESVYGERGLIVI